MSAVLKPSAPPGSDRTRRGLELFYRYTLPETGHLCLFRRRDKRHLWALDRSALVDLTLANIAETDLYCGTGSFKDTTSREATNALLKRAFYADFDAGPAKVDKHGGAVYATGADADADVARFCQALGLPPTLYVHTSEHGRHAWWCLTEDITAEQWLPVAGKLKRLFTAWGVKADPSVTDDVARVLRAPGTVHSTGAVVKLATLAGTVPRTYSLAEFEALIDAALTAAGATAPEPLRLGAPARHPARSALNADAMLPTDDGVTAHTIEELRSALAFLASIGHGGDYDEWVNVGQALHSLAGTLWEGPALDMFNEFSAAVPGYEGREAIEAKWSKLGGERTSHKAIFKKAHSLGWPGLRPAIAANDTAGAPEDGEHVTGDNASPTDLALSKMWVKHCGTWFRFDHARRVWMTNRGGAWVTCRMAEQVEAFKALAGELLKQASAAVAQDGDSKKAKRLMSCATRAQSRSGTEAALMLAQSDPAIAVTFDQFDQDPYLFNMANGVVHLPTGELRPHEPVLMLHRQSPVQFDPQAACPQFMDFIAQVSCHDLTWIEYMQTSLGYALSGHVSEERAQFYLGVGANGKSVLANICRHIWGTYAGVAPASFLMQSKRDASGATPELAMLPGVRLLSANETEAGSKLSAQTLKNMVSTEHIYARANYGNPFAFKPTHKLIVRGNHRPIITDDDEGVWRRIDLIPFDMNLKPEERDTGLEARLLTEAPGILLWLVEGFAKWQRDGLRPPKRIRDASLAYRRESDVLGQWMDDCCEIGHGFVITQRQAFGSFRAWCNEQGLRQFSKKSFTRSFRERGIGEGRESTGDRQHTYTGLRMRP